MIPSYNKTFLLVWPLMFAVLMIMIGNGLQGTLLGLRASYEEFPVFVTGIIMSLYYCGFLIGCFFIPKMISSVGHVRVFAAMASLASATILFHGVFVSPWIWGIVRVFSGLAFAGLFIVSESWLNNIATNKLRAQIFSTYISVIYIGQFAGQFMLELVPFEEIGLFIFISVLISLSLLPVTLANKPAPGFEEPETLPFKKMFEKSPLAMAGVFASGFCIGSSLGIGAVYANEIGMETREIAVFMAAFILGNAIIPLLTGWVSDKIDRRTVIIASALGAMAAALGVVMSDYSTLCFLIFGGMMSSIYSISIAYMNDQIKPEQMVSATTSLIFFNAAGACLGPLLLGFFMEAISPETFFYCFVLINFLVLLTGCVRAILSRHVVVESDNDFMVMPARSSPMAAQIPEDD